MLDISSSPNAFYIHLRTGHTLESFIVTVGSLVDLSTGVVLVLLVLLVAVSCPEHNYHDSSDEHEHNEKYNDANQSLTLTMSLRLRMIRFVAWLPRLLEVGDAARLLLLKRRWAW